MTHDTASSGPILVQSTWKRLRVSSTAWTGTGVWRHLRWLVPVAPILGPQTCMTSKSASSSLNG